MSDETEPNTDAFFLLNNAIGRLDTRLAAVENALTTLAAEQQEIRLLIADTVKELKPTIESLMSGPLGMLIGRG